ncbi:hypothetical protein ACFQZZ_24350 [Nocardia sp. GCM10030253]|uniref:hypothetical protein n=1 Tax=Nocardia sp. GCM10030253 TaxID=3273404 RepID=UPI00364274B9
MVNSKLEGAPSRKASSAVAEAVQKAMNDRAAAYHGTRGDSATWQAIVRFAHPSGTDLDTSGQTPVAPPAVASPPSPPAITTPTGT